MLIDFHSHILPGIDDGAGDLSESLALIGTSAAQGVGLMVATPHFYADTEKLETFFSHRSRAWETLNRNLPDGSPALTLGAEAAYFNGIGRASDIERLCVDGAELLLLEMPFERWSTSVISDVLELHGRFGVTVMLAHIERYADMQKNDTLRALRGAGVLFQSNADFFIGRRTQKSALKMFDRGEIHALGSDCHNMTARPPRLGEAMDVIASAFGVSVVEQFHESAGALLGRPEAL